MITWATFATLILQIATVISKLKKLTTVALP